MIKPYIQLMRLDKPIGYRLLFFPASWAVALAAPIFLIAKLLVIMWFGAVVTRAAGCILNDLTDRKLDARVERTKTRPLASGVVPVWHAYVLLVLLLAAALYIALLLPRSVFYLALLAVPMIVTYPWMKRITWWPQVFLGLTFNLSALFGWLATGQSLTAVAWLLYAAGIFWTLGYDTIYAVQDMEDDAKIGIRSTARKLGKYLGIFVAGCYVVMLVFLLLVGMLSHNEMPYYIGLAGAGLHMLRQLRAVQKKQAAGPIFCSNQWLGLMVLLGIVVDRVI